MADTQQPPQGIPTIIEREVTTGEPPSKKEAAAQAKEQQKLNHVATFEDPKTAAPKPQEAAGKTGDKGKEEPKDKKEGAPEGDGGKKKQDTTAQRINLLEKNALERDRQLKALQSERDTAAKQLAELQKLVNGARKDPLAVLKQMGLSFNDIADAVINDGKLTPQQQAKNEVKDVQEEVSALKQWKAQQEQQVMVQRAQEAERGYRAEIKQVIDSDPEVYELASKLGDDAVNDAWQMADAFFRQTGQVADPKSLVETLEKTYEDSTKKLLDSKKLSGGKRAEAKKEETKVADEDREGDATTPTHGKSHREFKKGPVGLNSDRAKAGPVIERRVIENSYDREKRLYAEANAKLRAMR